MTAVCFREVVCLQTNAHQLVFRTAEVLNKKLVLNIYDVFLSFLGKAARRNVLRQGKIHSLTSAMLLMTKRCALQQPPESTIATCARKSTYTAILSNEVTEMSFKCRVLLGYAGEMTGISQSANEPTQ